MKKTVVVTFLVFLNVVFVSQGIGKTTVAYAYFSNGYNNITNRITAAVLEKITNEGRYNLVTRNNANLNFIFNERDLFTSGLSSSGAEKLKLLGATYLLVFKMINSNYDTSSVTIKDKTIDYVNVHINASFVVISASNGQILKALNIQEKGSSPYGQLASIYVSFDSAYNNALNSAISQCADEMGRALDSLAKIYAVVIEKISDDQLLINQGSSAGIKIGDELKFVSVEYGIKNYGGEARVIREGPDRAIVKVLKTPDFPIVLNETEMFVITNPPPDPIFAIIGGILALIILLFLATNGIYIY